MGMGSTVSRPLTCVCEDVALTGLVVHMGRYACCGAAEVWGGGEVDVSCHRHSEVHGGYLECIARHEDTVYTYVTSTSLMLSPTSYCTAHNTHEENL